MRHIGNVPTEYDAVRLGDHLFMMGIEVQVEPVGGEWEVWVRDEDRVSVGRQELLEYCAAPREPKYDAAQVAAAARRALVVDEQRRVVEQQVEGREIWQRPRRRSRPLITVLSVLCVCVFVFLMGMGSRIPPDLAFSELLPDGRAPAHGWASVQSGQVWRLITPAFLHFGWPHLIMNLLALSYFGGLIEERRGTVYLGLQVLLIAAISNAVQFAWTQSPYFGGISGVVFGLFGYVWMMSEFRPGAGITTTRQQIVWVLAFYVLCVLSELEMFAGTLGKLLPSIANAAHTAGLVVGMVWGLLDARFGRFLGRRE
ncbi:MAG: rhomboid family intramembrane serine protease [Pirellulales bacterium]